MLFKIFRVFFAKNTQFLNTLGILLQEEQKREWTVLFELWAKNTSNQCKNRRFHMLLILFYIKVRSSNCTNSYVRCISYVPKYFFTILQLCSHRFIDSYQELYKRFICIKFLVSTGWEMKYCLLAINVVSQRVFRL